MSSFTLIGLVCYIAVATSAPADVSKAVSLGQSQVGGVQGQLYFLPEGEQVKAAVPDASTQYVLLSPGAAPQQYGFGQKYFTIMPQYGVPQYGVPQFSVPQYTQQQFASVAVPAPIPVPAKPAVVQVPAKPAVVQVPAVAVAPAPAPTSAPVPPPTPKPQPAPAPAPIPPVAVAVAAPVVAPAPVVKPVATVANVEQPGIPAVYTYNYGIAGDNGDVKTAQETRNGDKVSGQYTINDPDGTVRVVTYTVEGNSGFQAKVETKGTPKPYDPSAQVAKVVTGSGDASSATNAVISGKWSTKFEAPATKYDWSEKALAN